MTDDEKERIAIESERHKDVDKAQAEYDQRTNPQR